VRKRFGVISGVTLEQLRSGKTSLTSLGRRVDEGVFLVEGPWRDTASGGASGRFSCGRMRGIGS
jgi:hypothetical protein